MPGLNGWDVLAALKSDPVTADIPVVMLSVLDDQNKARAHGAAALMTKPLDGNKLKTALRFACDAQKAKSIPSKPTAIAS